MPLIEKTHLGTYRLLDDPPRYVAAHLAEGFNLATGQNFARREPAKVHTEYNVYRPARGRVDRIRNVADNYGTFVGVIAARQRIADLRAQLKEAAGDLQEALAVAFVRGEPLRVADLEGAKANGKT